MTASFVIEALDRTHDRKNFDCGVPALNRYLAEQAGQDIRRRAAACYIAKGSGQSRIAGYYTLSAGDVALGAMPQELAAKLPRYPAVPVARVGRLAVASAYQGKKLGAALLWDAAARAFRSEMAVFGLAVDAKDDRAAEFYRHLGFIVLENSPRFLLLPLETIAAGGRP